MCARNGCDNREHGLRRLQHSAHAHVFMSLLSFMLCFVFSLDLGFHVVIGVGRLSVQQDGFIRQVHFTTHTQYQVQSSFLLDVVVQLCPVIVLSICIPKFLHIFHRDHGSFEVLSLQTPKLPGRDMAEEAQISTQRDDQDPGSANAAWNTCSERTVAVGGHDVQTSEV